MIELQRGSVRVLVDDEYGARVASLRVAGCERLLTRERSPDPVLGWGSYPMVPWAGRVRSGRFVHDGHWHQLPLRLPPHALHGTVLDRPWVVDDAQPDRVEMHIDLGPHWPWPGIVRQTVELDVDGESGALRCRLEVSTDSTPNAGATGFPAQVGWHPWFADGDRAPRLDFAAQAMYRRDRSGIPTGDTVFPGPHPWDDCFVGVIDPPMLTYSDGLRINVWSDCDHWVIYEPGHALCVEPQSGPPDGFTIAPHVVRSGEPLSRSMVITW